jgi:hypothetical protein
MIAVSAGTPAKPAHGKAAVRSAGAAREPGTPGGKTDGPLDDTAEATPDTAATVAEELTRRTEALLLKLHEREALQQARIDQMKSDFDNAQAVRAELLREMNILRDMAVEQQKKDDEILKKYVAMI